MKKKEILANNILETIYQGHVFNAMGLDVIEIPVEGTNFSFSLDLNRMSLRDAEKLARRVRKTAERLWRANQ